MIVREDTSFDGVDQLSGLARWGGVARVARTIRAAQVPVRARVRRRALLRAGQPSYISGGSFLGEMSGVQIGEFASFDDLDLALDGMGKFKLKKVLKKITKVVQKVTKPIKKIVKKAGQIVQKVVKTAARATPLYIMAKVGQKLISKVASRGGGGGGEEIVYEEAPVPITDPGVVEPPVTDTWSQPVTDSGGGGGGGGGSSWDTPVEEEGPEEGTEEDGGEEQVPGAPAAAAPAATGPTLAPLAAEGTDWKTYALIAAGVLAVGGGVYFIATSRKSIPVTANKVK